MSLAHIGENETINDIILKNSKIEITEGQKNNRF